MSAQGGAAAATTTDIDVEKPRADFFRRFLSGDLGELRVILILVVIWAIVQVQEDRFLTSVNLTNLVGGTRPINGAPGVGPHNHASKAGGNPPGREV